GDEAGPAGDENAVTFSETLAYHHGRQPTDAADPPMDKEDPGWWGHPGSGGRRDSAQWAPAPVRARTSSSAYFAAFFSRDSSVPIQPQRKPSGMEMMPGLESGNHCQSWFGNMALELPETTGEKKTSTTALIKPP